jgi:Family of unknown function (DUF7009)
MKLRIKGNSLRLRVSPTEVAQIAAQGWAEDAVRFAADAALRYRLEVGPAGQLRATFAAGEICVTVPAEAAERWQRADEVTISGDQALPGDERLNILIEKDFECLNPRPGDDDADTFPNPAKAPN